MEVVCFNVRDIFIQAKKNGIGDTGNYIGISLL